MADGTHIEWTDATWNPVRGCSRVSEGCRHCYAEVIAARFSGPGQPYEGLAKRVGSDARWTGNVRLIEGALDQPMRWKKPRRIFVNSMSDLFHEALQDDDIGAVFSVMADCPKHVFQVLTKRPGRMSRLMNGPKHEPLLGPISPDLTGIHWVICGGESGPGARPMHPDWARSLRDQCTAAGVPFFFKQWGEWKPAEPIKADGPVLIVNSSRLEIVAPDGRRLGDYVDEPPPGCWIMARVGKRTAGAELDGREWREFPT